MSLEARTRIRRYVDGTELPDLDDHFIRDDYDEIEIFELDVTTSKVTVSSNIDDIQFLLVRRTGAASDITVWLAAAYGTTIDEFYLAYDLDSVSSLALEGTVATTVKLVIAGT